jgi:hypothetical protein
MSSHGNDVCLSANPSGLNNLHCCLLCVCRPVFAAVRYIMGHRKHTPALLMLVLVGVLTCSGPASSLRVLLQGDIAAASHGAAPAPSSSVPDVAAAGAAQPATAAGGVTMATTTGLDQVLNNGAAGVDVAAASVPGALDSSTAGAAAGDVGSLDLGTPAAGDIPMRPGAPEDASGTGIAAAAASVANPSPPGGGTCVNLAAGFYSYVFRTPCNAANSNRFTNQGYSDCASGALEAATPVIIYPGQAFVYTGTLKTCTDGFTWAKIKFGTGTAWLPAWKIINSVRTDFVLLCGATLPTRGHAIVRQAEYMLGHIYSWGAQSKWGPSFGSNDGCFPKCCGSSRYGFDCAGLTRYAVYAATGKDIEGGTEVQIHNQKPTTNKCRVVRGTWVSGGQIGNWGKGVPLPGDLIFFNAPPNRHVAIYKGWVDGLPDDASGNFGDMMVESKQTGWKVGQSRVRWAPAPRPTVIRCWA